MAYIEFKNVGKIYDGEIEAVKDFNLTILADEFLVLVGPSGCGKSTVLRMLAGLEEITSGEILIDGEVINEVTPKDRDLAMVFQDYALYPNMNVFDNMGFSLKMKKEKPEMIKEKVENTARILGLSEYLKRKPKSLSGGQRQRVALGRAIVRDPIAFLLDEPLSNLDAKLRSETRKELILLHERLKKSFIYVTHDQTEAMTMADRMVIMDHGVIQQVDSPINIYREPANVFVASFIGAPEINLLTGQFIKKEDKYYLEREGHTYSLGQDFNDLEEYLDSEIILGIRSEHFILDDSGDWEIQIDFSERMGRETFFFGHVEGLEGNIVFQIAGDHEMKEGEIIRCSLKEEQIHFFDAETEKRIKRE